jgi:hypothetical protein
MARHPEIKICDQHALISNEAFYATWMAKAGFHKKGENNPYGDLHIPGLLSQPVGRQLARLVLDTLGREKESLNLHSVSENDLKFNPAALSGRDPVDFLDLLTKDARLRKYNRH